MISALPTKPHITCTRQPATLVSVSYREAWGRSLIERQPVIASPVILTKMEEPQTAVLSLLKIIGVACGAISVYCSAVSVYCSAVSVYCSAVSVYWCAVSVYYWRQHNSIVYLYIVTQSSSHFLFRLSFGPSTCPSSWWGS